MESLPQAGPGLVQRLQTSYENAGASIQQLKSWVTLLDTIDSYLTECGNIHTIPAGRTTSFTLIQQCHSYWLAGVSLTLSGLLTPAYGEMRALLEGSLYAFYCRSDEKRQLVWMKRDESDEDRKNARQMFSSSTLMMHEVCESHEVPIEEEKLRSLYEDLIDKGAHPNVFGVLQNMKTDGKDLYTRLFNCGGIEMRYALRRQAEVGLIAAIVSRHLLGMSPPPGAIPEWIRSLAQIPLPREGSEVST